MCMGVLNFPRRCFCHINLMKSQLKPQQLLEIPIFQLSPELIRFIILCSTDPLNIKIPYGFGDPGIVRILHETLS